MILTDRVGSGLRIYNTMGKTIQEFVPKDPKLVKVFTCGPSVYARPHLGNYRTFLFEDVLVRFLRFKGYNVRRAMNMTDIEDKAILEAMRRNVDVNTLTRRNEAELLKDFRRLSMVLPDRIPRASRSVRRAVEIIKILLEKGIAYWHEGDVFYDPLKFPGFGRLYGLDMGRWPSAKRRFRKDTYPGDRWNLGDFILWHGCKDGQDVCWDEELGSGRPSWNVQDAAMVMDSLGDSVDIWCGGIDNLIRHHDYNIAVAEACTGIELSPFWLHGGHLLVDGRKMSKSRGNVLYPGDLAARGFSWKAIRLYLLDHPWRESLDLDLGSLSRQAERLIDMRRAMSSIKVSSTGSGRAGTEIGMLVPSFAESMDDDLNVRGAVSSLEKTLLELEGESLSGLQRGELAGSLKKIDSVLGVLFQGQVY